MKRTKLQPISKNPLFEQWLTEWKEQAAIQRNDNLQHCFSKAISSLKKYPLPLARGKDCIILQYFGPKLCAMLDKRLDQHLKISNNNVQNIDSDDDSDSFPSKKSKSYNELKEINDDTNEKKVTSGRPFIPKTGSACHALLITLYRKSKTTEYVGYMTKVELQTEAQLYCDTSLKKSHGDSYYTGWSSMSTLVEKGFVERRSSPAKYSLTDSGVALARALSDKEKSATSDIPESSLIDKEDKEADLNLLKPQEHMLSAFGLNDCSIVDVMDAPTTSKIASNSNVEIIDLENHEALVKNTKKKDKENGRLKETEKVAEVGPNTVPIFSLEPNTFDVILLVDTQETSGKTKQKDDVTVAELNHFNVQFEIRHLKVGDFAWIARCRKTNNELILPHIVERKRVDDLDKSIQDGRFHEQKFRLKQSGIKNLIYMVESYGKNQRTCLPLKSLFQASVNSSVQDGFIVKYTNSHKDSMMYLGILTNLLRKVYSGKKLSSGEKKDLDSVDLCNNAETLMEFKSFNKNSAKIKTLKVKEMLVRQLLQIKGVSLDKALVIVELYPTPKLLYEALNNVERNGEKLLASLQYGVTQRQIGPAASKIIYQLYTNRILN